MKKSEIKQIASALALQNLQHRMPASDTVGGDYGRERARKTASKIKRATTRAKIEKLLADEASE